MHRSPLGRVLGMVPLFLAISLVVAAAAAAQQIAGDYEVRVTGWNQMLGREPARTRIDDSTTLLVKQDGDRITVDFGSFASAMSATRFDGRVVDGSFVAIWASPSNGSVSILGRLEGDALVGDLLYSRVGESMVPGWVRVGFRATPTHGDADAAAERAPSGRPGAVSRPLPRAGLPGRVTSLPGRSSPSEEAFDVTIHAGADPEAPTSAQRVTLSARAVARPGQTVARTEIWFGGNLQRSVDGDLVEVTIGPLQAGRTTWTVSAVSTDGARSAMHEEVLQVRAAGESVVQGRITGPGVDGVEDVQLLTRRGEVVARAAPDREGRYRFTRVPAGQFAIFVNDGKAELRVSPSPTVELDVDGRSRYTRDFQAR